MAYKAEVLWFGRMYEGVEVPSLEKREQTIQNIIELCNNKIPHIEKKTKGVFKDKREVTYWGTHIEFPVMSVNHGKMYECRIRINPHVYYPDTIKHYSKIFVSISSEKDIEIGKFRDNFNQMRDYAEGIEEAVKQCYTPMLKKTCTQPRYEFLAEIAGIQQDSTLDYIVKGHPGNLPLLVEQEGADKLFKDLLEGLFDEKVAPPLHIMGTIYWTVIQSDSKGLLWGGINKNNKLTRIVGLANFVNPDEIRKMFKTTLIQMINKL